MTWLFWLLFLPAVVLFSAVALLTVTCCELGLRGYRRWAARREYRRAVQIEQEDDRRAFLEAVATAQDKRRHRSVH